MKTPRTRIASTVAAHTYYDGVSKDYAKQVAALLLEDGRIGELDSLLRDIQADWARHGYVEVLASTAYPLNAATKSEIQRQFKRLYPSAERIAVTEVHDPAIIGGVQLRVADQQLDLSVEGKLNKFKQLTGDKA